MAARMDKAHVSQVLRNMARLLELKGVSEYKIRAYDQGAERIDSLTQDLPTLVAQGKLRELPGIGSSLESKIRELVTTGQLQSYEELRAEFPPNILELIQLPELGPRKAAVLWQALGVQTLADLEAACRAHQVRSLRGFGARSEARLLESIEKWKAPQAKTAGASLRKLLASALPIADRLHERMTRTPGVVRASVAGSIRRFSETVSDINLVASTAEPSAVLEAFARDEGVLQVLEQAPAHCRVQLYDGMPADLRVVSDDSFALALHHRTGSRAHHEKLRERARALGITLSEWGAIRNDRKLPVKDEEALYALLELPYIAPELREDWGEYEAALEGALPAESSLVTVGAIRGAVHSHSTWSDGRNTLAEMAQAAKDSGLEYLTVTEHSQAASYAGGLTLEELRKQWEEIDAINEKLAPFRLLKGIEADILESGELDYPPDILSQLDVVIGSVHVRHKMDEEQMTRRILAAMDSPHLDILGHLTGRLILSREPYGLKLDAIFEKAAATGVVIEVNGSPERLDIKAEHVLRALRAGVKLVCSVDAHSIGHLGHLRLAVATARKGWARKEDVLNTLPAAAFLSKLRSLRSRGGRV